MRPIKYLINHIRKLRRTRPKSITPQNRNTVAMSVKSAKRGQGGLPRGDGAPWPYLPYLTGVAVVTASIWCLTGSKAAVKTAVVSLAMFWLSLTAASTPSLMSFCCSSKKWDGVFTAERACTAAVRFFRFFAASSW